MPNESSEKYEAAVNRKVTLAPREPSEKAKRCAKKFWGVRNRAGSEHALALLLDSSAAEAQREEREAVVGWMRYPCPCDETDCEAKYERIAAAVERGDHRAK